MTVPRTHSYRFRKYAWAGCFGFNQPTYRRFVLPAGRTYAVDIIDTWNMTVETSPETVQGRFTVELPGRQFIAVRLRAVA